MYELIIALSFANIPIKRFYKSVLYYYVVPDKRAALGCFQPPGGTLLCCCLLFKGYLLSGLVAAWR